MTVIQEIQQFAEDVDSLQTLTSGLRKEAREHVKVTYRILERRSLHGQVRGGSLCCTEISQGGIVPGLQ